MDGVTWRKALHGLSSLFPLTKNLEFLFGAKIVGVPWIRRGLTDAT